MDLTGAADELYGVRPEEFVARRTALAAEAREAGDRTLAAEIKRLAKPATAAWVVNLLVRRDPEQVEQVLSLGAALRQAQQSMAADDIRELGRRRRQLTAAVTRQARALAADLGQPVGDPVAAQVEGTLHAAMVDEDVAAAVGTGLLVKPLTVTGLEPVDVVAVVAVPASLGEAVVRRSAAGRDDGPETEPRGRPDLTVVPDDTRAIEQGERDLAEAEELLAGLERKTAKSARKVAKREAKGLQLQAELEELRRRLAEVEERIERNEADLADAEEQREAREQAEADARSAVVDARRVLESLRRG